MFENILKSSFTLYEHGDIIYNSFSEIKMPRLIWMLDVKGNHACLIGHLFSSVATERLSSVEAWLQLADRQSVDDHGTNLRIKVTSLKTNRHSQLQQRARHSVTFQRTWNGEVCKKCGIVMAQ